MPDPAQRAIALVLAVLTAPLLLALALAVRLDSSGPILYRAERVGAGGEVAIDYVDVSDAAGRGSYAVASANSGSRGVRRETTCETPSPLIVTP